MPTDSSPFSLFVQFFLHKNIHLHSSDAVNLIVSHLCMSPGLAFITFPHLPKGHTRLVCRTLSGHFGNTIGDWRYSFAFRKRSFLTVAGPRRILTCFHLSFGQFRHLSRLRLAQRSQTSYVLFTALVYHCAMRFGKENFRTIDSHRLYSGLREYWFVNPFFALTPLLEEADCVFEDWLITIAHSQPRAALRFNLREPSLALLSAPFSTIK